MANPTNNLDEKSRQMSLKVFLTGLVLISLILVGGIITILAVVNLRRGMEDEVAQGVMATCQTYAMVLQYTHDIDDGSTANLELDMHNKTGYAYTYFEGDTRVRSSISGVIGTKAGDAVITAVLKQKQSYQAQNVMINGQPYYVAYEPLIDSSTNEVYGMAFVGFPPTPTRPWRKPAVFRMPSVNSVTPFTRPLNRSIS